MKLTIKEIAEMTGVSKATVSRVLNNSKPVRKEIRDKVLKVIDETGYKPSIFARGLSNKHTNLIGIIIPDISNPVFSRIISGIESKLIANDYIPLISATNYDIKKEIEYIKIYEEKEVDGLILLTDYETDELKEVIKSFQKPIVMVGSDCDLDNIPVIKIDNYNAAYDAVNYLVNMGHVDIGMISGPLTDRFSGDLRHEGYKNALLDNSISYDKSKVLFGNYRFTDGYKAMETIFTHRKIPTAIFCSNDLMAIGAMKCALDNNLRIPEDISFVGFDDVDLSSMYNPTLTTIHQPFEEKGDVAGETILNMIRNDIISEDITLDYELKIRESSKWIR